MSNVWFIGDIHGGHKNVYKFRKQFQSEEDHFQHVKTNFHKVVKKRDKVFFMGDTAFTLERLQDISTWVCGRKVLICGNHCHTEDTELLTSEGFVYVGDITEDCEVASVDLSNGIMDFVKPSRIVVNEGSATYSVKGTWLDERVSSGHNIVLDGKLTPVKDSVGSYVNRRFTLSAKCEGLGVDITDNMIKLLTWVIMDGTIVRYSDKKTRVQFKLSKERKIERLETLLLEMKIPYTKRLCKKHGLNKLQPYYIRIYGEHSLMLHKILEDKKQLPRSWRNLSYAQVRLLLEELSVTDATKEVNKIHWSTTSKNDVDVIQEACVKNGIAFSFKERKNASGFKNGKQQYICNICDGTSIISSKPVIVEPTGCLERTIGVTVRHGTVVSRRNGKVSVTGNCTEHIPMKVLCEYFDEVHSLYKWHEFWLSHCPIHPDELRGKVNIHGHVHHATLNDKRYYNTSLENTGFYPVDLNFIRSEMVLFNCE